MGLDKRRYDTILNRDREGGLVRTRTRKEWMDQAACPDIGWMPSSASYAGRGTLLMTFIYTHSTLQSSSDVSTSS